MEKITQTRYGLWSKKRKKVCTLSIRSNPPDAEFCNETTVSLSTHGDIIYSTANRADIDEVLDGHGIPWYNSCVTKPELNFFKPNDLQVVKITLIIEEE